MRGTNFFFAIFEWVLLQTPQEVAKLDAFRSRPDIDAFCAEAREEETKANVTATSWTAPVEKFISTAVAPSATGLVRRIFVFSLETYAAGN